MQGGIERQLFLLAVYAAFTYPFACVPFLYFYFRNYGISIGEYGGLIAFYYWAMVVMEIPTGLVADRYGRKNCMVLGPLALSAGFLILYLGSSYQAFCLGQIVLGIGHSLLSGPPTALLYETLEAKGRTHSFLGQESRLHALRLAGTGFSFLVGGFLAHGFGLASTILTTAALCLVAAGAAIFLRDQRTEDREAPPLLHSALSDLRSAAILWILFYFVLVFGLLRYCFHTYQPFLEEVSGQHNWILVGGIFASLNLVAAPGSRLVPRLSARYGNSHLLFWVPTILSASLVVMSYLRSWLGVLLFFAHQLPFGMHWALVQEFVNRRIQNTARTTVLSALSFCGRLSFALWFPLAAWLQQEHGIATTYFYTGLLGLVLTCLCFGLGRRFTRA